MIANNNGRIPGKDLADITNIVMLNHALICEKRADMFGRGAPRFYR